MDNNYSPNNLGKCIKSKFPNFQTFGCSAGGPPNCLKEGEKGKLLCDGEVLSIKKLTRQVIVRQIPSFSQGPLKISQNEMMTDIIENVDKSQLSTLSQGAP